MAPGKTLAPIWIVLGFAAGAGFSWLVFRSPSPRDPSASAAAAKAQPAKVDLAGLPALEAEFQQWGGYAVWEHNLTEFAVREPSSGEHTFFVQVRRAQGNFYFRTLPRLTRPLIDHGVRTDLPFHFTETEALRAAFYRDNPHYDRTREPLVQVPPLPPQRFAPKNSPPEPTPPSSTRPARPVTPTPTLTPGAGR